MVVVVSKLVVEGNRMNNKESGSELEVVVVYVEEERRGGEMGL